MLNLYAGFRGNQLDVHVQFSLPDSGWFGARRQMGPIKISIGEHLFRTVSAVLISQ
jgi:hypothetical protein